MKLNLCDAWFCFTLVSPGWWPDIVVANGTSSGSTLPSGWDEITELKVSETAGQRMLTIEVVDPKKFVGRSFFMRMLNAANAKMMGSPINISSNSLRVNFDEFLRLLTEAFERYKGAGRANG